MIQSKLTVDGKVIFSGEFPEAAALRKVEEDGLVTTYCDNEFFSSRLTENRVGRYLLLGQKARSYVDCQFEVRRTGLPVLMMSLAKDSNMVRTRREDRRWRTGDV